MTTIVIFASSLATVSAFVLIKAVELKNGRRNFILGLMSRLDAKSHKLVSGLRFRTLQIIQSVRYVILVQSKIVFRNLVDRVMEKIMDEYRARQSTIIMGHKDIINKGSVSFYLKKIAENKGSISKGKIEESI